MISKHFNVYSSWNANGANGNGAQLMLGGRLFCESPDEMKQISVCTKASALQCADCRKTKGNPIMHYERWRWCSSSTAFLLLMVSSSAVQNIELNGTKLLERYDGSIIQ